MPVWLEVIIVWICLGAVLNLIAFRKGYFKFLDALTETRGYEEGYKDAAVNMRMFYAMKKEFPSTAWVRQSAGKDLGTREKILEHGFE